MKKGYRLSNLKNTLKALGPGLLFAGAAIGVSHIVQSTKAGALYGMGLLWAIVLATVCKYPFFQFGTRYALATKTNLLQGYYHLHKGVLWIFFGLSFATMFTIQTAVTIVTAGLATTLFGMTTDIRIWSVIITGVCMLIVGFGKYTFLDRIMKIIIIILSVSTLVTLGMAYPTAPELSLQQYWPTSPAGMVFLIALMGWMPAPLDLSVWQSLWTLEKQESTPSFSSKQAILDFNIGYGGTLVLGIGFVLLGSFVFYGSGEELSSSGVRYAQQLIGMYTKTLGSWAYLGIAAAAFTCMFSTTITTLDASPRTMAAAARILFPGSWFVHYWFWLLILTSGTGIILFFFISEMQTLVQIATVVSFLTAPFYAIVNYILVRTADFPKQWKPTGLMDAWSIVGILFLITFSIWYLSQL